MKITKKNVARLASISAVGAGALGVAAGTAEAGTIGLGPCPANTPCSLSTPIGFLTAEAQPGSVMIGNQTLGSLFKVRWYSNGSGNGNHQMWGLAAGPVNGALGVKFATLLATSALSQWAGAGITQQLIASRFVSRSNTFAGSGPTTSRGGRVGQPNCSGQDSCSTGSEVPHYRLVTTFSGGTDKTNGGSSAYLLFRFSPAPGTTDYGWLRFTSVQVNVDLGPLDPGPAGTLGSWEYYQTQQTPEPSTFFPIGLAALALGASGLRRWRASRKRAS